MIWALQVHENGYTRHVTSQECLFGRYVHEIAMSSSILRDQGEPTRVVLGPKRGQLPHGDLDRTSVFLRKTMVLCVLGAHWQPNLGYSKVI